MEQRPFTVFSLKSERMVVVWTRDYALAKSWAAKHWNEGEDTLDVWKSKKGDSELVLSKGEVIHYA